MTRTNSPRMLNNAGQVSGVEFTLAVSAGQTCLSRLRREAKLDQALRQRSGGAHRDRQQDQVGACTVQASPIGGIYLARPADDPDRHRSRQAARYGWRRATSTPPSRLRSAATAGDLYDPAATGISRSCRLAPDTARAPKRSRICGSARPDRRHHRAGAAERGRLDQAGFGRPISIASSRNAICRSSFRCASAISAARSGKPRKGRCAGQAAPGRGSNGSANSAICRTPSAGCRSWCRSA